MVLNCLLLLLSVGLGACHRPLSSLANQSTEINCSGGCSTRLEPLTAADGTLYLNECVARCQGAEVTSPAQPVADGMFFGWEEERFDQDATVSAATMSQYHTQGYYFLAKVNLYNITMTPSSGQEAGTRASPAATLSTKVTSEGYVYLTRPDPSQVLGLTDCMYKEMGYSVGQPPVQGTSGGFSSNQTDMRAIWGTDDRVLANATTYPYSAVGRLSLDLKDSEGACTGVLIGPSVLLTAAHCVYDRRTGEWTLPLTFTPAVGGASRPFGSAKTTTMTIYQRYVETGCLGLDLAVITLDRELGKQAGWLGYGYVCSAWAYNTTIAGYPVDLPAKSDEEKGLYMYTSLGCSASAAGCEQQANSTFIHQCDTFSGQSGSPMWVQMDGYDVVIGIHVAAKEGYNAAKQITSQDWDLIPTWSA